MMIFRLLPSSLSLVVVDDVDLMMRMAMDLMLFECERLLWRWVRSSFRPRDDRLGHHLVGMMMIRCCLPLYWPRGIMISREEMMFVCLCFVSFTTCFALCFEEEGLAAEIRGSLLNWRGAKVTIFAMTSSYHGVSVS